jgi:hypothetical protein
LSWGNLDAKTEVKYDLGTIHQEEPEGVGQGNPAEMSERQDIE